MEKEWREVRRKKASQSFPPGAVGIRFDPAVTSFYVCNLPGDARKGDLWKQCAKLGNLVDIYIVGRRDATSLLFAFVRYLDVVKPDVIEAGLNEMTCRGRRLKANCAKNPLPAKPKKAHFPTPPENAPMIVTINPIPEIQDWTNGGALVGTAKCFDTLCNFPSLASLEGFDICEVKYLGGMNVAVKSSSKKAGDVFKANKSIWLKWFLKVESFDKVAWVKVACVPPHAWDDANFAAILGSFGKILVFPSSFWSSTDISAGKLCILTAQRTKINDEIEAELEGTRHKIGVMEVEDDWIPFRPFVVNDLSESDESDEEADNEEDIHVDMELEE
ncbi:hypothetical protein LXL04_005951 [Taraxacum kok-saghyz]